MAYRRLLLGNNHGTTSSLKSLISSQFLSFTFAEPNFNYTKRLPLEAVAGSCDTN